MKKIALIAGHHRAFFYHWKDPGALPTYIVKREIALKYPLEPIETEHYEAERLVARASGAYNGKSEILVCPFNYDLYQKKKWIEQNDIDWVLSVHLNSTKYRNGQASGFEIWTHYPDVAARVNAQRACKIAAETLGIKSRGVKYSNQLYILKTNAKELLLEMGFIDNPLDVIAIREKGVQAILEVIKHITS
jgi:N-acetylmuramoyl-L-alanine amidase